VNNFVADIVSLHTNTIPRWKEHGVVLQQSQFLGLVEENHAFNYQLWHAEDRARRDDKGYEFVYKAKREIDAYNQQRNNRMEMMDQWLMASLKPAEHSTCRVHSETPGMIIDRLSILSLKAYHMAIQTTRSTADDTHRTNCGQKLTIIYAQYQQLQTCLVHFLYNVINQEATFRLYHQFKMYNDPALNPALYG
jgi:hypothetical protein